MADPITCLIHDNRYIVLFCSKQDVPVQNFEMHSIHCKRFLVPCPHCGDSVNKNDLEEHIEENHVKVSLHAYALMMP